MSVSPADLLERADQLVANKHAVEIDSRVAAHLAYYAAFHAARPHAQRHGVWFDLEGGSHEKLIRSLIECSSNKLKGVGYMLRDCRARRVSADYKVELNFTRTEALVQIEITKKVFAMLTAFEEEQKIPEAKDAS